MNSFQIFISSVLSLGLLGLIAGLLLAAASKIFAVKVDPRVEAVESALPGANCGACGYAGCKVYAQAIIDGSPANLCTPGGEETACEIAKILGVEAGPVNKKKAVILCKAGKELCLERSDYNGEKSCKADSATGGGSSACAYGCLAHNDCIKVCPVDAMKPNGKNPPIIDREKCIGCGKCVEACPRNLIVLEDASHKTFILCSTKDKGAVLRKFCKTGCIGCRICVKFCENESMTMEGRIPKIHYEKGDIGEQAIAKCPQNTIVRYS